jgi:hypothetical protein
MAICYKQNNLPYPRRWNKQNDVQSEDRTRGLLRSGDGEKKNPQLNRKCMTFHPTYLPSINVTYIRRTLRQRVNVGRAVGDIGTYPLHSSRPLLTPTIYSVSTKSLRGFEKLWRANMRFAADRSETLEVFFCRQQMA